MATIKKCDVCHTVWDPADFKSWDDGDRYSDYNRCTITVDAPSQIGHVNRPEVNKSLETCQDCARVVMNLLTERGLKR